MVPTASRTAPFSPSRSRPRTSSPRFPSFSTAPPRQLKAASAAWPGLSILSCISPERNPRLCVVYSVDGTGKVTMVGRDYFTRQAMTLLKFAKSTANPELAAVLVEKAAELNAQGEASSPPDRSPRAPDVEPPAQLP